MFHPLKRIALDGFKSSQSLIGKPVRCIKSGYKRDIEINQIYTISKVLAGNYDVFIYLEELPEQRFSEFSRKVVPNSFNIEIFELIQ